MKSVFLKIVPCTGVTVPAPVGGAGSVRLLSFRFAPKPQFLFFGADYPSLPQLFVVADFGIGKPSVLAEDDIEAQAENSQCHYDQRRDEYNLQHMSLVKEVFADRLVIVYFFNRF